ncbi:uncharacterized protein LOC142354917, partial [Convolutriloba macropyga]|uniref:uncharacterized protein LOC142354917 n=1 Tax=Convolutriloba macropyga TaxID=536237 RepID=UPI003F5218C7
MVSGEDYLGLFLAVTYSFCLCTFLLIAKLTPAIPYFVLASRALFHISISGIFLSLFWKRDIWIGVWRNYKLVFIRSAINGVTMATKVLCVRYITVADLAIISQTTPVFVCIIAVVVLGEKITLIDSFIIISCFSGVVCVMQPRWLFGSGNENLLGLASDSKPAANSYSNTSPNVAIASCVMLFIAFMNAVTSVLLKKLADEKVHPSAIILMSGCSVL